MESSGPGGRGGVARRPLHSAQAVDVASASSFRAFEILHLHLDLRVEFGPPGPGPGSRGLNGTAVLELRCLLPEGASELRLDSHSCLQVTAATLRRGQPGDQQPLAEPVPFHTQPFSHYGQALCVAFPQPCRAGERFQLELTYRVGEGPGVSARRAPGPQAFPSPPGQPVAPEPPGALEQDTWPCFCSFRRGSPGADSASSPVPALNSAPGSPLWSRTSPSGAVFLLVLLPASLICGFVLDCLCHTRTKPLLRYPAYLLCMRNFIHKVYVCFLYIIILNGAWTVLVS